MPKIQSYDIVSPSPSDLIVVTDASDNNSTKNIRVDSLSSATAPNYYGAAYYALTTAHTQVVSTVDTWEASTVPLTLNIFSMESSFRQILNIYFLKQESLLVSLSLM